MLTLMARIRSALRRHPLVADAVFAAVLAAFFARVTTTTGGMPGAGWAVFSALHGVLVWRRLRPLIVFGLVVVLAFTSAGLGAIGPALVVVPMIAAYTVARHLPRRVLWTVAIPIVPFTVGWLWHGGPPWDAGALTGMYFAGVLLGQNIQTRQAYLAALEDRADRLERERAQQARLVIATERARIAREMHDIVAHNLAVMVALSDGAVATVPAAPERAVDLMRKSSLTGREALTEVRRLVGLLRAGPDDDEDVPAGAPAPQPGLDDLDALIEQVRTAGLPVTLTREGPPTAWGPGAELAVYRIVQEALTNTLKHAGPRATAQVRLCHHREGIEVEVLDDGGEAGARPPRERSPGGHGLTGMNERAASYGGHAEAGPRDVRGWRVRAYLSPHESITA
jgi:signal transduction histidine kinase